MLHTCCFWDMSKKEEHKPGRKKEDKLVASEAQKLEVQAQTQN